VRREREYCALGPRAPTDTGTIDDRHAEWSGVHAAAMLPPSLLTHTSCVPPAAATGPVTTGLYDSGARGGMSQRSAIFDERKVLADVCRCRRPFTIKPFGSLDPQTRARSAAQTLSAPHAPTSPEQALGKVQATEPEAPVPVLVEGKTTNTSAEVEWEEPFDGGEEIYFYALQMSAYDVKWQVVTPLLARALLPTLPPGVLLLPRTDPPSDACSPRGSTPPVVSRQADLNAFFDGFRPWRTVHEGPAKVMKHALAKLKPGNRYKLRMMCKNSEGDSPWCGPSPSRAAPSRFLTPSTHAQHTDAFPLTSIKRRGAAPHHPLEPRSSRLLTLATHDQLTDAAFPLTTL